jgi:chromosome segregation ATPase
MSEPLEPRVKNVEDAILLLTAMALRADERMDTFDGALSNLTVKIEALADAQIRTEEKLSRLESVVQQMATDTNARLSHLAELVERHVHDGHA